MSESEIRNQTRINIHDENAFVADHELILNATNRTLTLTNVALVNAGDYTVTVSDSSGSTTSGAARLEVDPLFRKIIFTATMATAFSHACKRWMLAAW